MFDNETVDNTEGATTSNDDKEITSQDVPGDSSTLGVDNAENNGETKQDADGPKTIKEAMLQALNGDQDPNGESPASKDQEKLASEKAAELDSRLDKHPRFQEVIAQRDQATKELEEYKGVHEFLKTSTLSVDDRMATLQLGDKVNRVLTGDADPVEVLNELVPIIRAIQSKAGMILPDDIQRAVDEGKINPEYAKDLAATRAKTETMQNKAAQEEERKKQSQIQEYNKHVTAVRAEVSKAITDWETKYRGIDPDYEQKRELVYDAITVAVNNWNAQGKLVTAKDAVEISEAAYKKVNEKLQKAFPARHNIQQKNTSSSAPAQKVEKQPTTKREAMFAALQK